MTAAELRRIVGAMTKPRAWISGDVGICEDPDGDHDVAFARGPMLDRTDFEGNVAEWKEQARLDSKAAATLANHADALVALVEACERFRDGDQTAIADVFAAVTAVHATKGTP